MNYSKMSNNRRMISILIIFTKISFLNAACMQCNEREDRPLDQPEAEDLLRTMDNMHLQLLGARIDAHLQSAIGGNHKHRAQNNNTPPTHTQINDIINDDQRQRRHIDVMVQANDEDAIDQTPEPVSCILNLQYNASLPSTNSSHSRIESAHLYFSLDSWPLVTHVQAQSPVRKRREVVDEGNVRSTNNHHVVNVERYIQTNLAGHVVLRVRVYLNTCTNDSGNGFTMPTLKLSVSLSPQVTVTHLNNIPNDGITNPTRSMRSMGRLIGDCQQQWGNLSIIANTTSAHIQQTILPCCRRSLRVSFAALGWGDWVISPAEFDSYYCIGRCMTFGGFSNSDSGGALYADVRNRHNSARGLALSPCCSPVHFAPLPVTVRLNENEYMTQTLDDVLVTQCGCM